MGYAVDFDGQLYNGLSIGKAEAFASVFDRYNRLLYAFQQCGEFNAHKRHLCKCGRLLQ